MATHKEHDMHPDSLKTYREEKVKFSKRAKLVLKAFSEIGAKATDRDIADHLGFSDMNSVRPRITELCLEGYLSEVGRKTCPVTGKRVRECQAKGSSI